MRGFFDLAGLLVALAIAGIVVKKQLAATQGPLPSLAAPAGTEGVPPATSVEGQSQQIPHSYRQAIEGSMQQARPMPDGE
jgi:hypothetical protein